MNRRASFLAALAIALSGAPVACSWAQGILPASFAYTLHPRVPLIQLKKDLAPLQRVADVKGLFLAPLTRQAGEHADMSVVYAHDVGDEETVFEGRDIPAKTVVDLPPGAILNLGDVPPCTQVEFLHSIGEQPGGCPPRSQVGVVSVLYGGALTDRTYPLYKLAAADGHLATLGYPYEFIVQPVGIQVNVDLRADGDYGLTLSSSDIAFEKFVPAPFMTIWGVPAAAAHDSERWNPETLGWGDSIAGPPVPLVANATDCGAGLREARVRLRYWAAPEQWLPGDPEDLAYRSFVPAPEGCDRLSIAPGGAMSASAGETDSPAGIELGLELPRNPDPDGLETPLLEGATLTLPDGMSINPAAADGLGACTPEQIGLRSEGSPAEPIRFDADPPACPASAKLGEGAVDTPLLEEPLAGEVYFATPFRNPFHAPLALYLAFDGPGFTAKLAARVERDDHSGRLQARIESLPPVPIASVSLSVPGGERGPLITPVRCGASPFELRLAPRSGQPAASVAGDARFAAPPGRHCAADGSGAGGSLLQAGSRDATANGSSPLVVRLEGSDIRGFEVMLPRGLAARVGGLELCGEGSIGSAEQRGVGKGAAEERDPSCPPGSRVGSLLAGIGPSARPLFVRGDVYLAGPYKGAPFSLVAITPAIAGGKAGDPLFDLGTVVDRVALDVNPRTAEVGARAVALPSVLAGIPLRIASLRLVLDRPGFMRNPSDCGALSVAAILESGDGTSSRPSSGFRATGCERLRFRPRLRFSAWAGRRGRSRALRAVLRAGADEAAIARARVTLPASMLPDRGRKSIVGRASATSALLGASLSGPVYLRSAGKRSSELVLALSGEPRMEIAARVRRRARRAWVDFSNLPDAQLTELVLTLRGGRVPPSCGRASHVVARLVSHGGVVRVRRSPIGGRRGAVPGKCSGGLRKTAKRMEG